MKVLGKREIGMMIKWRGKVKQSMNKEENEVKKVELES